MNSRLYLTGIGLGAIVALGAIALTGCDDDDDDDGGDAVEVAVTLSEWSVNPARSSAPDGVVRFVATNSGPKFEHELVVVKTELGVADLPTGDDGRVDEEGEGFEIIGEIEGIEPGKSDSAELTLTPGKYVIFCNLEEEPADAVGGLTSHYQLGMRTAFTVD